jgi:hypothetical protein
VLIPVLVLVSCSMLFVGRVTAVQDQRAGGTLPIRQTFTYKDGTALAVADINTYSRAKSGRTDTSTRPWSCRRAKATQPLLGQHPPDFARHRSGASTPGSVAS